MTTIPIPDIEPSPGVTHVFIIGIGYYPFLVNPSPRLESKLFKFGLSNLEPLLSCPPISAKEFAKWMEKEYHNPKAPLASIDMFISAGKKRGRDIIPKTESYTSFKTGISYEIDRATPSNIESAFIEWLARCNEETTREHHNVAIFYFCGHGLGISRRQILPFENFGECPEKLFRKDCIDLDSTLIEMKTACRAEIQSYFIDSCLPQLSKSSEISGNSGITLVTGEGINSPVSPQLILRASSINSAAYGEREKTSYFTQALIESFNRYASGYSNEKWIVRLSRINEAVKQTVARLSNGIQNNTGYQDDTKTYTFHELEEPPQLPVNVCIEPSNVAEKAQIELKSSDKLKSSGKKYNLPPWDIEIQASIDYYNISVNSPSDHVIIPPRDQKLYANNPMEAPIKHKLTLRKNNG